MARTRRGYGSSQYWLVADLWFILFEDLWFIPLEKITSASQLIVGLGWETALFFSTIWLDFC
jgi:hypothetical protein